MLLLITRLHHYYPC